eukprot:scaffold7477_cov112-Isochrysis_galbana.AAC.3
MSSELCPRPPATDFSNCTSANDAAMPPCTARAEGRASTSSLRAARQWHGASCQVDELSGDVGGIGHARGSWQRLAGRREHAYLRQVAGEGGEGTLTTKTRSAIFFDGFKAPSEETSLLACLHVEQALPTNPFGGVGREAPRRRRLPAKAISANRARALYGDLAQTKFGDPRAPGLPQSRGPRFVRRPWRSTFPGRCARRCRMRS